MISHQHQIIFVHMPRTAGTSIEVCLVGKDWWGIDPDTKHIPASRAKSIYAYWWDQYTTFTVVRDDAERKASYLARFGNHENPASFYLDAPLDVYLRFSHLEEDWKQFARTIGAPETLPHVV